MNIGPKEHGSRHCLELPPRPSWRGGRPTRRDLLDQIEGRNPVRACQIVEEIDRQACYNNSLCNE